MKSTDLAILAFWATMLAFTYALRWASRAFVAHIAAGTRPPRWLVAAERTREYIACEGPIEDRIDRRGGG